MDSWINYLFIIALIVSFIANKNNWCDDKGYCQRNQCNRLFNRDLIYCFIIFVLFSVAILTWKIGTQEEIAKQLSFAGTVTSIILSVLAIFITMLSEMKSSVSKTKMDNLVYKIEVISAQTDQQVNKSKEIQKQIDSLVEESKKINQAIQENVMEYKKLMSDQEELVKEAKNLFEIMKEARNVATVTKNLDDKDTIKWNVSKIVKRGKNDERK